MLHPANEPSQGGVAGEPGQVIWQAKYGCKGCVHRSLFADDVYSCSCGALRHPEGTIEPPGEDE